MHATIGLCLHTRILTLYKRESESGRRLYSWLSGLY